jgi:hypothetical protein
MTDIVATETAKAREQTHRLPWNTSEERERIITALLEAKAEVLEEINNDNDGWLDEECALLRQEVTNRDLARACREARGL